MQTPRRLAEMHGELHAKRLTKARPKSAFPAEAQRLQITLGD